MEDFNFEKAPTFLVRSDDNDNGGKAPTAGTRCGAARHQDKVIDSKTFCHLRADDSKDDK